MIMILICAEY